MIVKQKGASSRKKDRIFKKLENKEYRDSFVSSRLRVFLSGQIQKLRGDMTQKEFGEKIGKPQSVVSRLENSDSGQLSVQSLLDIASKLDIALIVRFADFPTFIEITDDFSDSAVKPKSVEAENERSFLFTAVGADIGASKHRLTWSSSDVLPSSDNASIKPVVYDPQYEETVH